VVRGADHLSNTPKQLLVLEAAKAVGLGEGAGLPQYAHLPLLHGRDGKKLSKRHGAASVGELREAGYLPEALRNYLALLGWGREDDQTVMSTEELIRRFSLDRVSRKPAIFDETKLKWMNGTYIRALPLEELVARLATYLDATPHAGLQDDPRFTRAVAISQEKIHTLADFWPLAGFIFAGPATDPSAREKWLNEDGRAALAEVRAALAALADFDQAGVQTALEGVLERLGGKPRTVYQPVRVAISGTTISPGIFESVALLGREETLRRIDAALEAAR
jgi:glutamyl-tRNA synthetase